MSRPPRPAGRLAGPSSSPSPRPGYVLDNLGADIRQDFSAYFNSNDFSGIDDGDLPITQGTVLSDVPLVS